MIRPSPKLAQPKDHHIIPVKKENHLPNHHFQVQLVGGFNPVEKYARQIGSFPKVEVEKIEV